VYCVCVCVSVCVQEARRDAMLVTHLMRQSLEERRIIVQLLQVRHEKDVIRRNRVERERQIEELRTREFEYAMAMDKV